MDSLELIKKWVDRFNAGDAHGLSELYAPDAVNHQMPLGVRKGRESIKARFEEEFSEAKMHCQVIQFIQENDWVVLEWKDPNGLQGCGFFRIQNGQIQTQRGYWDSLRFQKSQGKDRQGVELETARLNLRRIRPSDRDFVFRGMSDPQVYQYYGIRYTDYESTKEQMEFYEDLLRQDTGQFWLVEDKHHTDLGIAGYYLLNKVHRSAEIGIWLIPEHWGKGYMKESLEAVMAYLKSERKLHRIEASVETENLACIKGLTALGMQYEGTWRQCEFKDGRFVDLAWYAWVGDE